MTQEELEAIPEHEVREAFALVLMGMPTMRMIEIVEAWCMLIRTSEQPSPGGPIPIEKGRGGV
jgi:hypothetical protein